MAWRPTFFPGPLVSSPGVSPAPGIGPAQPCGPAAPPFPCFRPAPRWRARSASAAPQAPVRSAFSARRAPSPSPSLRREARTSVPHFPFLSPSRVFLSLPRQWRYSDGKSPVHRATWKAPVRQVIAVPRSPFLVRHSRPPIKPGPSASHLPFSSAHVQQLKPPAISLTRASILDADAPVRSAMTRRSRRCLPFLISDSFCSDFPSPRPLFLSPAATDDEPPP